MRKTTLQPHVPGHRTCSINFMAFQTRTSHHNHIVRHNISESSCHKLCSKYAFRKYRITLCVNLIFKYAYPPPPSYPLARPSTTGYLTNAIHGARWMAKFFGLRNTRRYTHTPTKLNTHSHTNHCHRKRTFHYPKRGVWSADFRNGDM